MEKKRARPMFSMDDGASEFISDEDEHSSDESIVQSSATKKTKSTTGGALRTVSYSEMRNDRSALKGKTSDEAKCLLCNWGLFSDLKGKSPNFVKVERKIRTIVDKFINVQNLDLMMTDICQVINSDFREVVLAIPDAEFVEQTPATVREHFLKCIIDPVFVARNSVDFWMTLFQKGKDTVLKEDEENGALRLDKDQVQALINIDKHLQAGIYTKDPRLSMFYNPNLTVLPKGTASSNLSGGKPKYI